MFQTENLYIETPNRLFPDFNYMVQYYTDFTSEVYNQPLTAGSVVECRCPFETSTIGPYIINVPAPSLRPLSIEPVLPHVQTEAVQSWRLSFNSGDGLNDYEIARAIIKINGYELYFIDNGFMDQGELGQHLAVLITVDMLAEHSFEFDADLVNGAYEINSIEIIA